MDTEPVDAAREPAHGPARRRDLFTARLVEAGWRPVAPVHPPGFVDEDAPAPVALEFRTSSRVWQRCEYVTRRHPVLSEMMLWSWRVASTDTTPELVEDLGLDVLGRTDPPGLPVGFGDRTAAVLDVITTATPTATPERWASSLLMPVLSKVAAYEYRWDRPFEVWDERREGLPLIAARSLDDAVEALRAAPDDGERWVEVGAAALAVEALHVAVAAFERATSLGPVDRRVYLWRAWLLRDVDPRAALDALDRGVAAGETSGLARMWQGEVYRLALHDDARARLAYERAVHENPESALCRRELASHLLRVGRPAEAVRVLEEAVGALGDAGLHHVLGRAHLRAGDRDAAFRSLGAAIRARPAMADEIICDGELAEVRYTEEFAALEDLADIRSAARHRALRRSRFGPVVALASPARAAVALAGSQHARHLVRLSGADLRVAVVDPGLRAMLTRVGLPDRVGGFVLHEALREGRWADLDRYGHRWFGAGVPWGLGGLVIIGWDGDADARDAAAVAVDEVTGEVFRIVEADDFESTRLASGLADHVVALCARDAIVT